MNLREQFELRQGKIGDRIYQHVLDLALDDQKQYVCLTQEELNALLYPVEYPASTCENERLDEIRERLLESMAIIVDIIIRRDIHKNN